MLEALLGLLFRYALPTCRASTCFAVHQLVKFFTSAGKTGILLFFSNMNRGELFTSILALQMQLISIMDHLKDSTNVLSHEAKCSNNGTTSAVGSN